MMKFSYLFIACLLNISVAWSQSKKNSENVIQGEIFRKPNTDDTIYFKSAEIPSKYYKEPFLYSKLKANKYALINEVSYPQMYAIVFSSDKNIRPWRNGDYFIDSSTTIIKTDYLSEDCNLVNGRTAIEYYTKFIPFIVGGKVYDCKSNNLSGLFDDHKSTIDSLLFKYVSQNPDSYVALWKLIERFSSLGQSSLRQKTLFLFSNRIKKEYLWKLLNDDFKNAKIKEGSRFPYVALKGYDLKPTKLILKNAKYTLIDYWFARCRPCLDTIPELKKLYNDYNIRGFNIISISVDETANIPIWQKRVKEHNLIWPQYLEENNLKNNELGINEFPTFILLDNKGKIIWSNFDLHDLDKFLKKHLKSNAIRSETGLEK